MDFEIGQVFDDMYPPEAADWCNSNGAYIEELEQEGETRKFQIKEVPEPSDEEKAQVEYASLRDKLKETDYIVIKIAEGSATTEEYAEQLANRKAWRTRVQELEELYPSLVQNG